MGPHADEIDSTVEQRSDCRKSMRIPFRLAARATIYPPPTALMLEWLAHPETIEAAHAIRRAVAAVLADPGSRTLDLNGHHMTTEMGHAILTAL
jgi:isocitrate/isopropylmalate dehydrogenase